MTPLEALAGRFPLNAPFDDFDARYVTAPHAAAERLADSLRVDPTGARALVGVIGSGKSSELHRAADRLREMDPTRRVVFDDADELGDGLARFGPGVLLRRALDAIAAHVLEEGAGVATVGTQVAQRVVARAARERAGASGDIEPVVREDGDELSLLLGALKPRAVTVFLDSFDRVSPVEDFVSTLSRDLRALRDAGVGLAITAPIDVHFLRYRDALAGALDTEIIPTLPSGDPAQARFLGAILARRDRDGLLSADVRGALVEASGGHLRSLTRLAQSAALRASREARTRITLDDAVHAREEFRTRELRYLERTQFDALRAIAGNAIPPPGTDLIPLVRSALIFDEGEGRYRVHPALLPSAPRRVA